MLNLDICIDVFYEFNILKQAHVDVLILQVREPIVCGITSLGYDHMEILG